MPDPATTNSLSFKDGHIAMTLTTGQGWWNYSDIKAFKWGAAALPFGADGRRDALFTDSWLMYAKSAHPQEAWTFIKYLASAQIQESWLKVVNTPPVRLSLTEKWAAQYSNMKPEEVKQVFLGAFKYGRESPSHLLVKYDTLNQIITAALKPVYANQLKASDSIPPSAKALDDALLQIQKDFKK
jgi:multiple sugar transport system substrate-binding protein